MEDTDSALVAELSDSEGLIDKYYSKIQANIDKYSKSDPSDQNRIKSQINSDLKSVQAVLDTMNIEITSLKSEGNEEKYKESLNTRKEKYKALNENFKKMTAVVRKSINAVDSTLQRFAEKGTSQEMMNRGDAILDQDDVIIQNMGKKIDQTKDISNNIKADLQKQLDMLDVTNKNLKEMDNSLSRATKTLGNMARMMATDKLIMAFIVIIVILIIIVIVFSVLYKQPDGGYNSLNDIFSPKQTNQVNK